jgi:predicted nucleotidyltransferase
MKRDVHLPLGYLSALVPRLHRYHSSEFRYERVPMRPSVVLDMKRSAVRAAVARFRTANPRVFGSVLHGTDGEDSDLDLLVDALPGATLLDLGDLEEELKLLLGVDVDLLTPGDLPPKLRAKVLAEAQPV